MTLVFAGVMAAVLGAVGVFVYLRFSSELDSTIDAGLRSRADDVAVLVREAAGPDLGQERQRLVGRSESFAEVLSPGGRVEDSSAAVGDQVLLSPEELRQALAGAIFLDRGALPGLEDESRLLAVPVKANGTKRVVVVGTSTEPRSESLTDLIQLLLIGGPVALLLASVAAYWVAARSLKPVDEMRSEAAAISAAEPDARLPVPPSGDEIARLGTTLNEMLGRLAEALEHERAFVADASHELRTPLAILRGELELALAEGRSPQELREAIASAAEETDRLTQLSEDLLTIAQTDRGELPLKLSKVDLGEVAEGVARRFGRRAEVASRRIVVSGEPTTIDGDRLRLEQAIGSLVDNALRYGDGEIALKVSGAEGVQAEIHVTDEGPGFPEGFLPRAFERFSRASSSRSDGGSGLGLSIVRTVARAHGGDAHAANAQSGADVWLVLSRSL